MRAAIKPKLSKMYEKKNVFKINSHFSVNLPTLLSSVGLFSVLCLDLTAHFTPQCNIVEMTVDVVTFRGQHQPAFIK